MEIDIKAHQREINDVKLDPEALRHALDAVTEAFEAGGEEQEQFEAGLRAYLWVVAEGGNRNTVRV